MSRKRAISNDTEFSVVSRFLVWRTKKEKQKKKSPRLEPIAVLNAMCRVIKWSVANKVELVELSSTSANPKMCTPNYSSDAAT